MKKNFLSKIILTFVFLCSFIFPQELKSNKIAEGIEHHKIINLEDTLVVNVLEVNLDSCNCSINTVKAGNKIEGLQTTTSMTSGDSIIASVNADFFEADGSTINNMISGGYIIKALSEAPYDRGGVTYSQIAFDKRNKPYIERFLFSGNLISNVNNYNLYGINAPVKENELILFNNFYNINTLPNDNLQLLKFNTASGKYTVSRNGFDSLSSDDFILLNGKGVKLSDTVIISLKFNPDIQNLFMLSGGWPEIIKNGWISLPESEIRERVSQRFTITRHPRTGVGFSKDSTRIYFFVVDGRQAASRGMSLEEFAELMLSYDVYNAINLDGGGSSTMVINGEIVNNPSDRTGERKVGSAIYVRKGQK